MYLEMRVDSYLKGLAETRARADADYQRALETAAGRTDYLSRVTAAYEAKRAAIQKDVGWANAQAQTALRARMACDMLIQKLNQGVDPALIGPVNGWQGRYGKRGALGQAVQAVVEQAYPLEISTTEVARALQQQFKLTFSSPAERKKWVRVTVSTRLGYLRQLGCIERLHNVANHDGKPGRWRAIPPGSTANDLIALATQAGLPLTFFSEEHLEPESGMEEDDLPR